jgi:hypothetical protein
VLRRLGVVVGGQLFLRICRGLLGVGVVLVSLVLRGVVGISAMHVLQVVGLSSYCPKVVQRFYVVVTDCPQGTAIQNAAITEFHV